ncbi:threonine/serine exporter ThrE family protein [Psychromonas sp. 14N.309.X.WAT.B.A12]|uniref:threonine/serine ThrE exporter family protein n=1 Tax=unclassified Psychromonas TaxID=2614957 RepID=UPI0025B10E41|nr:threonine/serine exporter family protein [Psychromonas sp. 14N.309.X.WAT.B.A12]MDN2662478.1 threonine/serine exporter family protein [Psychromonas sp. 14N.309.X.WAT.B.A12]
MSLSKEAQTELTRVAVFAGQILHQHGAESRLIEQTTQRIGLALGADNIELSVSPDAIVITSLSDGHCVTTTRRCFDRGINMQMVCEVQRICVMAEKQLLDVRDVKKRLKRLIPFKHNRWLVVLMIGFSCASFSHFFGGDRAAYWVTFVAAALAMILRQELAHRHHNPFVNFAAAAFVATTITSFGVIFEAGENPQIAMAASVLLLVPGFPLINSVSDMLKGHINMGIARWVFATLLAISVSIGIVASMTLVGVSGWTS